MSQAAKKLRDIVIERTTEGEGRSTRTLRRAAFENSEVDPRARPLVEKVARHAWKVTRADLDASKAAGLSEDEIFELTICAALGQAARQLDAALAALDEADAETARRS